MEGANYIIPKEENTFMHEERIRRKIILNYMIHRVSIHVPIDGSSHEKQHMFNLTLEEFFFKKKP
jgi:hypothetical protein